MSARLHDHIIKPLAMASQSPPPPYTLRAEGGSAPSPSPASLPPPLPPRNDSSASFRHGPSPTATATHDSRSMSAKSLSLEPSNDDRAGRRRLLLVYIHGFMGDETSFRNFPAHVHNLVSITLAESHVVHTKLYPKYRSRYALEVARDDFSNWYTTDTCFLARAILTQVSGSAHTKIRGPMSCFSPTLWAGWLPQT